MLLSVLESPLLGVEVGRTGGITLVPVLEEVIGGEDAVVNWVVVWVAGPELLGVIVTTTVVKTVDGEGVLTAVMTVLVITTTEVEERTPAGS